MLTPHEFLSRVSELCRDMASVRREASRSVSQADRVVSRIYHEIEFQRFNAAQGFWLAKRLQQALQHRRIVKLEDEKIDAFVPLIDSMTSARQDTAKRLSRCETRHAQYQQQNFTSVLKEIAATSTD